MKSMLSIFGIIAGGYAVICLLMYLFQSSLIYFPSRSIIATPDQVGMEYQEITTTTSDGLIIQNWYIPAEKNRATVLFFHGNAGNISGRLESIAQLHEMGLNVMIVSYRGYGQSEGRPSEQGTYKDGEAAWNWLTGEGGKIPQDIIIFGRSLGGGTAAWLAAKKQPGGLVLESTFTSVPDLASELYWWLPVRLLARINYPNKKHLQEFDGPVMIAHSPGDDIIPYHHGRSLYKVAGDDKRFLEMTGGHNDGMFVTGADYLLAWDKFISHVTKSTDTL